MKKRSRKYSYSVTHLRMHASFLLWILGPWAFFSLPLQAQMENTIPDIKFEHLTTRHGLTQNGVFTILQDHRGFLWFGTRNGLDRYDGLRFKHYYRDFENPQSLPGNSIQELVEDRSGNLWIATLSGLARLELKTETITRFVHRPNKPNSLPPGSIDSILEDKNGVLWVAPNSGLYRFEPESEDFRQITEGLPADIGIYCMATSRSTNGIWIGSEAGLYHYDWAAGKSVIYEHDPKDEKTLSHLAVMALEDDGAGFMWVATASGLCRLNTATREITRIDLRDPQTESQPLATSLKSDSRGVLWMATQSGMTVYNPNNGDRRHLHHNPADLRSLPGNNVQTVSEDRAGVIWLGTFAGGAARYNRASETIAHLKRHPQKPGGFNSNNIMSFYEAPDRGIWLGAYAGGICRYDPRMGTFENIPLEDEKPGSEGEHPIFSIVEDEDTLWLATANGLFSLNPETREVFRHEHPPDTRGQQVRPSLNAMVMGPKRQLWAASFDGLLTYDIKTKQWSVLRNDPQDANSLALNALCSLLLDRKGRLWVGTLGAGLDIYHMDRGTFTHHPYNLENLSMLGSPDILCFLEDRNKEVWVGTLGGGLYHYQEADGSFRRYSRKDGLFNEKIFAMVEDDVGQFWLGTNQGISRFDPVTRTFKNLDLTYNLQANEFSRQAALKSRSGSIYMGGLNGFNIFEPAQIAESQFHPQVVFTGLEILNKQVKLSHDITELETLRLSHRDRAITFQFAALDFYSPDKNQFAYKLGDGTEDWIPLGNKGELTFPKLTPGNYHLNVRGSNHEGTWSDKQAQLQLVVPAPWWNSLLARSCYLAVLALLVYLLVHHQRVKLKREQETNEKLRQVDRIKDEFLANTSHELRTPLHGIVGLAETLLAGAVGRLDRTLEVNLSLIISCGRRLESLVNDILDLSKIRSHELVIDQSQVDLSSLVNTVLTVCAPLANDKELVLASSVPPDFPPLFADEARLEQIFYNLVGNAIKFTEKGFVRISAEAADGLASIRIADSGIGFKQELVEVLFESFRQGDGSTSRTFEGAGLGLAITRELIHKHGGSIRAESTPGRGAIFIFTMPLAELQASVKEIPFPSMAEAITSEALAQTADSITVVNPAPPIERENRRFEILAVDDEPANRQILSNMLNQQHYGVTLAVNGQEALDLLETRTFDLVLLDVMMPKLSGFEVCRRMRTRFTLHELPIIFLTARTRLIDLVQGFEMGANDYVNKPFSREALLSRIRPHLELLDINRNLESLVNVRTRSLSLQTRELETLDSIVKTINREMESSGLLPAILEQGVALFPKARGGAILLHDEKKPAFSAVVTQPYTRFLDDQVFPAEGIEDLFMNPVHQLADHFYAIPLDHLRRATTAEVPGNEWLVCSDFSFEGRLDGFLLLLSSDNPHDFPKDEVSRLLRYREHAVSALARVRMLAELDERRNDLVEAAHFVGRSENARLVLHEMGNNLNSINTSVELLMDSLSGNRWRHLVDKLASALDQPQDLAAYLQQDPDGQRAGQTLTSLFDRLDQRDQSLNAEIMRLRKHLNTMLHTLREQHQLTDVVEMVQPGDLNDLIRSCVKTENPNAHLQVRLDLELMAPFPFPKIKCMQLLSTMLRSTKEFIAARSDPADGLLELQTRRLEDCVTLRFSDNGVGIPPGDIDKVFCQGYSTGEGLGSLLHHGANLVREMGGSIEMVPAQADFSTTIVLSLPINPT